MTTWCWAESISSCVTAILRAWGFVLLDVSHPLDHIVCSICSSQTQAQVRSTVIMSPSKSANASQLSRNAIVLAGSHPKAQIVQAEQTIAVPVALSENSASVIFTCGLTG